MTLSIKLTKEERTGKKDPIFKEKRGFHALLDRPPRPEDEEARQARVRLEMGKYDMSLDNFITVNERPEPQSAPKVPPREVSDTPQGTLRRSEDLRETGLEAHGTRCHRLSRQQRCGKAQEAT